MVRILSLSIRLANGLNTPFACVFSDPRPMSSDYGWTIPGQVPIHVVSVREHMPDSLFLGQPDPSHILPVTNCHPVHTAASGLSVTRTDLWHCTHTWRLFEFQNILVDRQFFFTILIVLSKRLFASKKKPAKG